jgi:membrane associated rhomboid family serine protease
MPAGGKTGLAAGAEVAARSRLAWGGVAAESGAVSDPMPAGDPDDVREREGLVRAGRFASMREAAEHGLVVLAMGLSYWMEPVPDGFEIWVDAAELEAVKREFELNDRANVNWPPPRVEPVASRVPAPWFTPLLWAAAIVWAFRVQLEHGDVMVAQGALDGHALFLEGEWWRPFTALFLHADLGHLTGNVVSGVVVFTAVIMQAGAMRGWLNLGGAAVAANILTAAVHLGVDARSIGASTAVFAGLGWLTGHAVRAAWQSRRTWWSRAVWIPLGAGATLLAWWGGGGDLRTDVVAHAAGFLFGVLAGAARRVALRTL